MMRRVKHYPATLLIALLLITPVLFTPPLQAGEAEQFIDAPIEVPESLIGKLGALRLKPDAGSGVVRYMATDDAGMLREWLRSEGYLDAKVAAEVADGKPRWRFIPGPLWQVGKLDIEPATAEEQLAIHPGDPFRSTDYDAAKTRVLWRWRDAGHLKAAFIESAAIPNAATHQVDIVWHIEPGPLYTISELRIEGAKQYDPKLVRQLSRLYPGETASQDRLQAAMQRIDADERYQHAIIVPVLDDANGNQVPVRISVSEAGWRKLTGDAGYSTDSGAIAAVNWVDCSLMNGLLEYSLRGELSRTNSGVGATLRRPLWPVAGHSVGMDIDYNRVDSNGRRYNSLSGGPFWQWNFRNDDYLRVALHGEQVREAGARVVTIGPRADLHFAHTHGQFLPDRGWRADIGLDVPMRMNAPGLWPLLEITGRHYSRPFDWLLVSPRAGFGRTFNLQGTVPKTYLQFTGGGNSIRGYALDSLGPVGADGLATGGLMKSYVGADFVLMPDAEWVSPVLFTDAGKLWQAIGANAPTVWSFGAGLIVHTPAGPLRIDLALPQSRRPQDSAFQLYITLGEVL